MTQNTFSPADEQLSTATEVMDLGEVIDIAPGGIASQSSLSELSLPDGAQALVRPHKRGFGCHTALEENPWWMLDLLEVVPIGRIVVYNRTDPLTQARAANLQVEISVDARSWRNIHSKETPFGDGQNGPPLVIEVPLNTTARFVRLSLPGTECLHLRKLEVLATRGDMLLAEIWRPMFLRALDFGRAPKSPGYRLVRVGDGDRLVGLKVKKFGFLANNLVEILNALHVARNVGLDCVVAPDVGLNQPQNAVSSDGVTLLPHDADLPPGLYLEGDFFYTALFASTALPDLKPAEKLDLARRFLVPFTGIGGRRGDTPDRDRELVIHIRSGDIFAAKPHPGYVQPPLSYYTTVVGQLRERGLIDRVCIVSEDRVNPCIAALEAFLQGAAIPFHLQSGSLVEDVGYISGARHLVFGFGTFGLGACLLAGEIETLHVFDINIYNGLPNIRELTVTAPKPDSYIPRGQWRCSPEQLQQMLDHPADDLVARKITG